MSERLVGVAEQLRGERDALRNEVSSLRAGLTEREAELGRIEKALKALGDKSNSKTPRKPAATKDEVIAAIEVVLRSESPLDAERLREAIEKRITAAGKSRMGFALRFKEALADPRFIDSPGGVRHVETEAALQPPVSS